MATKILFRSYLFSFFFIVVVVFDVVLTVSVLTVCRLSSIQSDIRRESVHIAASVRHVLDMYRIQFNKSLYIISFSKHRKWCQMLRCLEKCAT